MLSDGTTEAAQAFGLAFQVDSGTLTKYKAYGIDLDDSSGEAHHILPVPALFILATDGTIRFAHAGVHVGG